MKLLISRRTAALSLIIATALHAHAQTTSLKLIPMPREVHSAAAISIPNGVRLLPATDIDDQFAESDFALTMAARGIHATVGVTGTASFTVELLRVSDTAASQRMTAANLSFDPSMQAEGYVLITAGNAVTIISATSVGDFYGLQTLKQMITFNNGIAQLNGANIRDWPAMRYRGVHDDLSRGPVPTLEFQKHQIQTFAAYKINVYSPYFENTLAYNSSPLAAPPGGALTPDDVAQLVAYAKAYHVTIIPEQESFAHLHHLLTWEQYQPLAETPHGDVLAPGQPGSITLITSWFNELATEFPGPFLHIGADETFELGLGQTQQDVTARGLGPVYLDFLQKIQTALAPLHRRLLFWGDIAMSDPQDVAALPAATKQNLIAVAWEYTPEPKGYAKWLTPYTSAGIETWVAPGIWDWRRVYPNYNTALANIQGFTRDGQAAGATGQLNTVWNDDGEGLFNNDWYGILFGAAAAWQSGESSIPQFQQSYGLVFHGDATGDLDEAQRELMLAESLLKEQARTGDAMNGLFWMDPWSKDGLAYGDKIRPYTHDLRLHAERALTLIAQARTAAATSGVHLREPDAVDALELGARRIDFIGLKFQLADEMTAEYAHAYAEQNDKAKRTDVQNALNEIGGINGRMQDLRDGYSLLGDMFSQAWNKSNRPYWLHNVSALYTLRTELWINRADKFRTATRQWDDTHTLPPASPDIGIGPATSTAPVSTAATEPVPAPAPPPCKPAKHHKCPSVR